jgi:hypothetical protein
MSHKIAFLLSFFSSSSSHLTYLLTYLLIIINISPLSLIYIKTTFSHPPTTIPPFITYFHHLALFTTLLLYAHFTRFTHLRLRLRYIHKNILITFIHSFIPSFSFFTPPLMLCTKPNYRRIPHVCLHHKNTVCKYHPSKVCKYQHPQGMPASAKTGMPKSDPPTYA